MGDLPQGRTSRHRPAAVVCGDLNSLPGSDAYAVLTRTGPNMRRTTNVVCGGFESAEIWPISGIFLGYFGWSWSLFNLFTPDFGHHWWLFLDTGHQVQGLCSHFEHDQDDQCTVVVMLWVPKNQCNNWFLYVFISDGSWSPLRDRTLFFPASFPSETCSFRITSS